MSASGAAASLFTTLRARIKRDLEEFMVGWGEMPVKLVVIRAFFHLTEVDVSSL